MFPKTASSQDIQRNYRKLFDAVMSEKEPLVILNKNKAEVVIVDIKQFENMQKKIEAYELAMAKQAIQIAQREKRQKKLRKLRSLSDLL